MEILSKKEIPLCCGKKQLSIKLDGSIMKKDTQHFTDAGYLVLNHFYKSGIFYAENDYLIITSPFGGNELHLQCKTKQCEEQIINLEKIIYNI